MINQTDAVRATWEDTKRIAAKSHAIWSFYAEQSSTKNELPAECIQLRNALGRVPAYLAHCLVNPALLKIQQKNISEDKTELFISGTSTWRTSSGDCDTGVKSLHHNLLLGIQNPTLCEFARDCRFIVWPQIQSEGRSAGEGNYLAILIFAWAYILSARWIEMQRIGSSTASSFGGDRICYSQVRAPLTCERLADPTDIVIDIGLVEDDAARWWAAILASGEGWHATITRNGKLYRSPWSVCSPATPCFRLRRLDDRMCLSSPPCLPATSEAALRFLSDFCLLYNIRGQCSAALAACLYLPFLGGGTATLPFPKPYRNSGRGLSVYQRLSPSTKPQCDIVIAEGKLLPYYMTLSCNTWGIQALLCSVFFDPDVSCNVVSPWLEPIFEIISPIVEDRSYERLAAIMGKRQPKLAALWLGAIIVGVEKPILQAVHSGLSAVELHAAA